MGEYTEKLARMIYYTIIVILILMVVRLSVGMFILTHNAKLFLLPVLLFLGAAALLLFIRRRYSK